MTMYSPGLLTACQVTPVKSLVVVFTDNGTKDLKLEKEIMRIKKEKEVLCKLFKNVLV